MPATLARKKSRGAQMLTNVKEVPEYSRPRKSDLKQIPYSGPTRVWLRRTKFSPNDDVWDFPSGGKESCPVSIDLQSASMKMAQSTLSTETVRFKTEILNVYA
jgi:hypothetical protein